MLKQQQEEAASRECTFHPVINHRSDRLMSERSEVLRVSISRPLTPRLLRGADGVHWRGWGQEGHCGRVVGLQSSGQGLDQTLQSRAL